MKYLPLLTLALIAFKVPEIIRAVKEPRPFRMSSRSTTAEGFQVVTTTEYAATSRSAGATAEAGDEVMQANRRATAQQAWVTGVRLAMPAEDQPTAREELHPGSRQGEAVVVAEYVENYPQETAGRQLVRTIRFAGTVQEVRLAQKAYFSSSSSGPDHQ